MDKRVTTTVQGILLRKNRLIISPSFLPSLSLSIHIFDLEGFVTVTCSDETRGGPRVSNCYHLDQMPGPSNSREKRKRKSRRDKDNLNNRAQSKTQSDILLVPLQPRLNQDLSITNNVPARESLPPTHVESNPPSPPSSPCVKTPSFSPYQLRNSKEGTFLLDNHIPKAVEEAMFKQPFIHDPGNGPRVRIARDFISSFFAQPPAFDVSFIPNSPFRKQ